MFCQKSAVRGVDEDKQEGGGESVWVLLKLRLDEDKEGGDCSGE